MCALRGELERVLEGEVRFGAGDRALYSTDSLSYRQLPIGVVIPKTIDDVVATVAACRRHGLPLLSRGGGTSLAGQCCNAAVVMDFSKHLNAIVGIDRQARTARVQPGLILDTLRDAGTHGDPGVTFGPTPSTHVSCTIGGMIGNNSCGNYSIMSEFYGPAPGWRTTSPSSRSSRTTVSAGASARRATPSSRRSSPAAVAGVRSTRTCATCGTATAR